MGEGEADNRWPSANPAPSRASRGRRMSAPLTAPECDLRDFAFMPLDVRRLLTSETWIEASDDPKLGHALVSLWCESSQQVPAGSLPNNERVLARFAMCDAD